MKKNKNAVVFSVVLFAASFIYLVVFNFKLKTGTSATYNPTFGFIKAVAASPIFYFSMAYIVAALVLSWANKPIAKKIKKASVAVSVVLEICFVLLITIAYFGPTPPYILMWFAFGHPLVHIVPGALISIGVFKD